jgi:pimeloyl-ACP methyl ester carboxylesterase
MCITIESTRIHVHRRNLSCFEIRTVRGLRSSSSMLQPLLTRLADRYRLVAPDYPGFGHSDWPDPKQFDYTFDHISSVMADFTQALGLSRYTL